MTLLPHDNRNVKGLDGPAFPKFKVGPVCCAPDCSRYADHAHHLWRRSALGGPFHWVELWDHTIVGNVVPLCWRCHDKVTRGEVWMRWDEVEKAVVWDDNSVKYPPRIFPQPPLHGEPLWNGEEEKPDGPASQVICPGCKRPLKPPKEPGEKTEPARRRKTWVVRVPDDTAEDGGLVLDTLIEECRRLFAHSDEASVRYFTLVQALALVVQHGHLLTSSSTEKIGA